MKYATLKTILLILIKYFCFFICVISVISSECFSQEFNFVFEPDSIPVEIEGWNPYCPFAGGLSQSVPDMIDLDDDGDLDIFFGNFQDYKYFKNAGSCTNPDFLFIPEMTNYMNAYGENAVSLADIDADGDYDLFVEADERIWYYENIGTPQEALFELITDSLEQIIWWAGNPDIVDIDDDGDYDLFTGRGDGIIGYYRNDGTPLEFDFTPVAESFYNIDVGSKSDPCFVDIDNDNDYDLFIGEKYGRIWYYRNDGDSVIYNFTYITDNYDSIDVGSYSSPEFADIDHDGDYDMFVGRETDYSLDSKGDMFFYENVGTPEIPQWQLVTKNYLSIDIGILAKLQMIDINGDEAIDMLIGTSDDIHYYENIGNNRNPSFRFIEQGFQSIFINGIKPAFVDINNDGNYDLFAGEAEIPGPPSIALYYNNGTPTEPNLQLFNANYITNNDFFVNICPGLADIDADGDYDLFATDDLGRFYFYLNEGSPYSPNFDYITDSWQGINNIQCGWRGFSFGDIDEDGDLDLLIENVWQEDYGNLRFYRNNGTIYSANMVLETNVFLPEFDIADGFPYLTDIDEDGDLDLFCGEQAGGVMFFRNHGYGGGDVVLTLTPHNTPIQIQPGGGFFTFDVEVENISTTNYIIDFITDATLPNGSNYPIFLRPNITLNAGVTIVRLDIMQTVPGHAPSGEYLYNGYVRDVSTQDTLAVDSFEFTKLAGN